MSTHRESWYCCTFRSERYFLSVLLRAWSREAAETQFAQDVRAETDERGSITIEPGLGGSIHASRPASGSTTVARRARGAPP